MTFIYIQWLYKSSIYNDNRLSKKIVHWNSTVLCFWHSSCWGMLCQTSYSRSRAGSWGSSKKISPIRERGGEGRRQPRVRDAGGEWLIWSPPGDTPVARRQEDLHEELTKPLDSQQNLHQQRHLPQLPHGKYYIPIFSERGACLPLENPNVSLRKIAEVGATPAMPSCAATQSRRYVFEKLRCAASF